MTGNQRRDMRLGPFLDASAIQRDKPRPQARYRSIAGAARSGV